jgi:hypothetical protein
MHLNLGIVTVLRQADPDEYLQIGRKFFLFFHCVHEISSVTFVMVGTENKKVFNLKFNDAFQH